MTTTKTTIELEIRFNTAFRISQGYGQGVCDDVIDEEIRLPATSLIGVMSDAARMVLPGRRQGDKYVDHHLVDAVFGKRGRDNSPWNFSDGKLDHTDDPRERIRVRSRVAIDERRRARAGALFFAEELHADRATATISLTQPLAPEELEKHVALLHVAARLVDGIGADRRRGLGWVSITTDTDDIEAMVNRIERARDERARNEQVRSGS